MAFILHIDTALGKAHCALSQNGQLLAEMYNGQQQDHASWLHTAVDMILKNQALQGHELSAVSVTEGPGSYTGLRVGMAAAKGLCYAWQLPLITVSPLKLLAMAGFEAAPSAGVMYALIDARRMEVFMAGYHHTLAEAMAPAAVILDKETAAGFFAENAFFCGNGAFKMALFGAPQEVLLDCEYKAKHHVLSAFKIFAEKKFANVAYAEPMYIKPVYSGVTPHNKT